MFILCLVRPAVGCASRRTLDRTRCTSPCCATPVALDLQCAYTVRVSSLRIEWDPRKAEVNRRKHGVTFEDAQTVFYDERARLIDDPDHSDEEERFVLLGLSSSLRLLVVVHCYRSDGNLIRIISARKADREEQRFYP
jgi:uncharacterized protein